MTERVPEGLIGRSLGRQEDPRLLQSKGGHMFLVHLPQSNEVRS